MIRNIERRRLETLFEDLERLAGETAHSTPEGRREIEELRTRLTNLEEQLLSSQQIDSHVAAVDGNPLSSSSVHPIVYERDQLGYAYIEDNIRPLHSSGYTISHADEVMTTPLTVSGQKIGEMRIAPSCGRQLTEDEIVLTNAIAQQTSIQIENLRLLAAAERSRTEAESATRRFIHESWDSYLDAIQREERIGYSYDRSAVSPLYKHFHVNGGVQAALKVMDEQVGILYVERGHDGSLTEPEKQLVHAVADQVAQQVENIRLLADASRARADAEESIRRIAHDNWQNFTASHDNSALAFIYDSQRVRPLTDANSPEEYDHLRPLIVNGETIGQLAVAGVKQQPAEAAGMLTAIAAQASIHLETLRLNDELKKRAEELKELDRVKSAFLANMSHELRTPLNSIIGFTDVMLEGIDGALTEYMKTDLRLIQKNGQHLLHLINDVLDMAKIESGRMTLHPEKFVLHSVLEEVTSITAPLASEKNLSLFIEEDSDQCTEIYADMTRIRQVVINIVNNSIKFSEHGKIRICAKPTDDERMLITIKDNGIGIPPDKLESIFQEFTQVDTSTTRKVGGTGLGLPISRRFVEMHGGRLWAESTGINGQGSVFYIELLRTTHLIDVIAKQDHAQIL